jgi:hypothetical protein
MVVDLLRRYELQIQAGALLAIDAASHTIRMLAI